MLHRTQPIVHHPTIAHFLATIAQISTSTPHYTCSPKYFIAMHPSAPAGWAGKVMVKVLTCLDEHHTHKPPSHPSQKIFLIQNENWCTMYTVHTFPLKKYEEGPALETLCRLTNG